MALRSPWNPSNPPQHPCTLCFMQNLSKLSIPAAVSWRVAIHLQRGCCSNPTLFLHLLLKSLKTHKHGTESERRGSPLSVHSCHKIIAWHRALKVVWLEVIIFFFILFHIFLKWKCEHLGFGCTSFCCTLKTLNATCLAKPPSFKVKKF